MRGGKRKGSGRKPSPLTKKQQNIEIPVVLIELLKKKFKSVRIAIIIMAMNDLKDEISLEDREKLNKIIGNKN